MKKQHINSIFLTSFSRKLFIMGAISSMAGFAIAKDVAIAQFVDHQALNELSLGVEKILERDGVSWEKFNAQGNPTTAAQISKNLLGDDSSLIIALATPMAQAIVASKTKKTIIFGAVTDPKAARLTDKDNVSGVTDNVPVEQLMDMILSELPKIKRVGTIYNSGETNSAKTVEDLKKYCEIHSIELREAAASKSSEVSTAVKYLIDDIDVLVIPLDNTVVTSLESIIFLSDQYKIPVVAMDTKTVEKGVLFAYGVDWQKIGKQIGEQASAVLKGKKPSIIGIVSPDKYSLVVNRKKAKALGINFSKEFYDKAEMIVE